MELYNYEFIDDGRNRIHKTAIIADNVKLGRGNTILPYSVIGYPGAIRGIEGYKGKIEIGDNNFIGAHVTIMAGKESTRIGDKNIIMNHVNIGHDTDIGYNNEIGAGTILGGHVTIGDTNKIKIGCIIRNRVLIGNNNTIGQGSNIVQGIKNFKTVYGNPAREIE